MGDKIIAMQEKKYSKLLSGLFCSAAIIVLSFLCILNTLTLDLYSATFLVKVVVPGAFCFWLIGSLLGRIFDNPKNADSEDGIGVLSDSSEAYEIPSVFSLNNEQVQTDGADAANDANVEEAL